MKKLLFILALVCLYAFPARAQLVITSDPFGNLVAPVDQGGWHDFKATLTRNVTFTFVGVPPPSQSQVTVTVIQDGTGGRVITFGGNIVSPGCLINSTPNSTTFCFFHFDSTTGLWTWIPTSTSASQLHGTGPPSNPCSNGFLYTDDSTGNAYSCKSSTWVPVSTLGGSGPPVNPCTANSIYTDNTTGNQYSCNAGTWLFVGPVTTTTGPSCSIDTFTATPTYTFAGADQCHIMTLTGNVTSITIAGTPANHTQLFLKFPQDGTGGRTVTFPGSFILPTGFTLKTAANAQNNMAWQFDGTLWRPLMDFGGGGGGSGTPGGANNDTQCNKSGTFSACVSQPTTLYAKPFALGGNDANSGLTWDTAKASIMAAVCALPNGNCTTNPKILGQGTVYFANNVACNSNPNAGCWIAGNGDSQYPNMTNSQGGPSAWTVNQSNPNGSALNLICVDQQQGIAHQNKPSCQVQGPDKAVGVGNLPLVWIAGVQAVNIYGLSGGSFPCCHQSATWGRIGIDSTQGEIIGTPTLAQSPSVNIENISTANVNGNSLILGGGPQIAIGNNFWNHLRDVQFQGNNAETCLITSATRASNVVTVTTNSCGSATPTICPFLTNDHLSIRELGGDGTFNGTFKAATGCSGGNTVTFNQPGPNGTATGANATISDDRAFGVVLYGTQIEMERLHTEGDGIKFYGGANSLLTVYDDYMEGGALDQPMVWESSLVDVIGGGGGAMSLQGLALADTPLLPAVINEGARAFVHTVGSQSTTTRGGQVILNTPDSLNRTTGLLASGQSGWYDNTHFEASTDIARRQIPMEANIAVNIAQQNSALWTGSNFTIAGGQRDPFGGSGAVEVDATAATSAVITLNTPAGSAVNDAWYFGAWVRAPNLVFSSANSPLQFFLTAGDLCYGGTAQVTPTTQFIGDGNWFFVSGACSLWSIPNTVTVQLQVNLDATHPVQIYRPFLFRIAAGAAGFTGTEANQEVNSYAFGGLTGAAVGDIVMPYDKKLCLASGNFGVSNEFCGYFVHANTANRTYTLPDSNGTVVLTTTQAPPWSTISNPTTNETLTMGTNTSTFNFTSGLSNALSFVNTTAATSGTSQTSPQLSLCGNAWHAGASNQDCLTIQHSPGNGTDATVTDTYGSTGSSTGVRNSAFPGPVISGAPNPAGLAGEIILPQGTANNTTAAAVGIQGGTAITPYNISLPNVAPTTNSGFLNCVAPAGSPAASACTWTAEFQYVSSLPATCSPASNQPVFLTVVPYGLYQCTSVNVWTPVNAQRTVSPLSYGAKADVQFTYAATLTSGSGVVTCATGDCQFQCPLGVYPCTSSTSGCPNSTCDAGKIAFATLAPSAVNGTPGGTVEIAQTTIASVQSLTQATTTATSAANCTPSSTQICAFVWGTQDDATALNSAATAAWGTAGTCGAVQLPAGNMFIGGPVFNVSSANMSSACGGTIGGSSGADFNQTGPELYGQGPSNTVLIPLPNYNFSGCTFKTSANTTYTTAGSISVPICNGSTPNLEAHDFGINGLGQGLNSTTHAVTLWGFTGSLGGAACTGSTGFNLTFAGWGMQSTNSLGVGFGYDACGDPVYNNIVVESFGQQNCQVNSGGNSTDLVVGTIVNLNAVACFGNTLAALGVSSPNGGIVNSNQGYYAGVETTGPAVVLFSNITGSGQAQSTFNSSGDFIDNQFASSSSTGIQVNNGGVANFYGDNILIASGNSATSQVFFLNGTNSAIHIRNSTVTATGTHNRLIFSASSNNFFDDGGNTFFPGTVANTLGGAFIGEALSANLVLATAAKTVLSAGWGSTAAATAFTGGDFPISFTVTNSGTGQGASPTITYTFPTALQVAPISCTATQIGGTNATGTFTSSSLSTTGVTFTFSLTPTASSTEIVQVTCVTP